MFIEYLAICILNEEVDTMYLFAVVVVKIIFSKYNLFQHQFLQSNPLHKHLIQ